jgi:hypothetical protein
MERAVGCASNINLFRVHTQGMADDWAGLISLRLAIWWEHAVGFGGWSRKASQCLPLLRLARSGQLCQPSSSLTWGEDNPETDVDEPEARVEAEAER